MEHAHLPPEWDHAMAAAAGKRVLVLGATDVGKSSFIRAFLGGKGQNSMLIDLDPGQKLLGPPGTATLGRLHPDRMDAFIFLGSTSSSNIGAIARAGAALAERAGHESFVVNTSGFVAGLGARLQALTLAAVAPDLVVEIGKDPTLPPIAMAEGVPLIRLQPSPAARRKSPSFRAAIRQQAFDRALDGAGRFTLPMAGLRLHPGPPAPLLAPEAGARPVCALVDRQGSDMGIGVVEDWSEDAVVLHARPSGSTVATVRLGKMWAAPDGQGGWRLLEKLSPAWMS